MSARRLAAVLLAMMLAATLINILPGIQRPAAAQGDAGLSGSALTLQGKGEFENLNVTVSQTKNLINQVVSVTWQGGVATVPAGGYSTNYLQIMQCWGDDPGPDRTQCQFGAVGAAAKLATGNFVRYRQLSYGGLVDPNETLTLPAGSPVGSSVNVPFWPVGGDRPTNAVSAGNLEFFNSQTTNEVPLARTRADGSGEEFFEVQTARQAPGLGCGDPITTGETVTGRKCWLVVVPRGAVEVDGTSRDGFGQSMLHSSPLSKSNWDNRIVFPLEFLPVRTACPLGVAERGVVGHELAVDAVGRWQPALCADGAIFSYTQVPDDIARNQVLEGGSPGLALMTNAIPPAQVPTDHALVYAPVGLSGLAIAFNIEHQPNLGFGDPEDALRDGQRFLSMKLTPRLVAKLLTQSYQAAVAGSTLGGVLPEWVRNNPRGLTLDPEFLGLNPDYEDFATYYQPPVAMVQLGGSDLTSLLWRWVIADEDAREFLAGTPDEHEMVVNPNNKGLILPRSDFPRNDQSCVDLTLGQGVTGTSCTLDLHPFFNDMHEAGLSASRGDAGSRTPAPTGGGTVVLTKDDRQAPGSRALIAVVDTATAHRYGLPTASLANAAGEFVTPTTESLLAGAAAMKPSAVPDVLASDPVATDKAAYPLTALSYAVASPSTLDAAAGKDYAALVRYAAGPGQQLGVGPGQLPFGMAPLPDSLRAQAVAAAATIEAQSGKNPSGTPTPAPTSIRVVPGAPTDIVTGGVANSTGSSNTATNPGGTVTSPGGVANSPSGPGITPGGPATNAGVTQQPVASVQGRTPRLSAPAVGALLLTILICGAVAATSSPLLHSPVIHRIGAAVLRRLRKGVRPTER